MRKKRAPSKATRLALAALLEAPEGLYGYELIQTAGISPGTLYPMLARLEDQGLLTSRWQEASVGGRPPRHVYNLSKRGRVFAMSLNQESRQTLNPQMKTTST